MTAQPEQLKPKLLDQARVALREKHYSIHTEHTYIDWMHRFILFHNKRHPREMAAPEIEEFLTHLAVDRRASSAAQQQALSAILFLYREVLDQGPGVVAMLRPKRPARLPATAMTREEARQVIAALAKRAL